MERFVVLPVCALALLVSGCSLLRTPVPEKPPVPLGWQYDKPGQGRFAPGTLDFWMSLGDPGLPPLLIQAIENNDDLKLSTLQMKLARLQSALADTTLWPDVTLGANASITRPFSTQYGIKPRTTRSAGMSGTVSYPLDIWGAEAAQVDAANLGAQASEDDWHAAQLTLQVAVTQGRWQLGYLNRVIADAESDLQIARDTQKLAEARYAAGATPYSDVVLARQTVATQQAAQTQNRQQLVVLRNAYVLTVGAIPGTAVPELDDVPDTPLPVPTAGLPADILTNRPDVHAAERRVRSAFATADATRLGFYPTLTLTGTAGTASPSLGSYLTNPVGTLSATLALPFVQFNVARLTSQSARVNAETAAVTFHKTLYAALQDVENNLSARQWLAQQDQFLREALVLALEAERLTKIRWLAGSTDIQPWLDAQQARRQNELSLLQVVLARRNNVVGLYAALGGQYRTGSQGKVLLLE